MRYAGQWRAITVHAANPFAGDDDIVGAFESAHQREYNDRRDGATHEIFRLTLTAVSVTPKAELKRHAHATRPPVPRRMREVVFADITTRV